MNVFAEISQILKDSGVNFFAIHPCEKVAGLYNLISKDFKHVSLAKEEEGVGICAGAFLAGAKPAMLIQSSGLGNMPNALCSLTQTYQMPLLVLASWRGIYQEGIVAQIPLGKSIPKLLEAINVNYTIIEDSDNLPLIANAANECYQQNKAHVVLLSPKLSAQQEKIPYDATCTNRKQTISFRKTTFAKPVLTRFEILQCIAPFLKDKIVVCNLGIPSKELYSICHQKSNFYMLGSMGLASSIGLGLSLFTPKEVVVIDGDGSLLANLGTLSTIAKEKPKNLTIIAIDNGAHGSTGNQPTATASCVDLEKVARASGFKKTCKEANPKRLLPTLQKVGSGPNFVHLLAKPGNSTVPNVPLTPEEIKRNVQEAILRG